MPTYDGKNSILKFEQELNKLNNSIFKQSKEHFDLGLLSKLAKSSGVWLIGK